MGDTIAVSDLAQKMGIKGKEVIKKLWALGMMGVNINQDVDLDTATLIATEFGYQIESTAFNEDEVIADAETQDSPEDLVPRAPVVTGSAATGAFIQLPGMPPRGEAGVPKIEIKDRDEELRRLGRTGLINRQPAGRDRYGRPAFGAPGQRPGAPPRKKVAAAGK